METNQLYYPDEPVKPLDLRTVPIWAIPQLVYIRDKLSAILLKTFEVIADSDTSPSSDELGIRLVISEGDNHYSTYIGKIYKWDMLTPYFIPRLYNVN